MDTEKQVIPEAQGIVAAVKPEPEPLPKIEPAEGAVDYVKLLQEHKGRGLYVDAVRRDVLSRTRPRHWIARKGSNQPVTLALTAPGAECVKSNCVLGYQNRVQREESWTKEHGPGFTIYFEADFWLGHPASGTIHAVGSCASDDDFFSIEHKELPFNRENPEHIAFLDSGEARLSPDETKIYIRRRVPMAEVSRDSIVKAAYSNMIVNGVMKVLGIRDLSPDELAELSIDVLRIQNMAYLTGKRPKLPKEVEREKRKLWRLLRIMNGGDEEAAADDLMRRTAFTSGDGRTYPGCGDWNNLTENQIHLHYPKIKEDYKGWRAANPAPRRAVKRRGRKRLVRK